MLKSSVDNPGSDRTAEKIKNVSVLYSFFRPESLSFNFKRVVRQIATAQVYRTDQVVQSRMRPQAVRTRE